MPRTRIVKKFRCEAPGCGKAFARDHALRLHTRYHTGERPLICSICDASFPWRSGLAYHLKHNVCQRRNYSRARAKVRKMVVRNGRDSPIASSSSSLRLRNASSIVKLRRNPIRKASASKSCVLKLRIKKPKRAVASGSEASESLFSPLSKLKIENILVETDREKLSSCISSSNRYAFLSTAAVVESSSNYIGSKHVEERLSSTDNEENSVGSPSSCNMGSVVPAFSSSIAERVITSPRPLKRRALENLQYSIEPKSPPNTEIKNRRCRQPTKKEMEVKDKRESLKRQNTEIKSSDSAKAIDFNKTETQLPLLPQLEHLKGSPIITLATALSTCLEAQVESLPAVFRIPPPPPIPLPEPIELPPPTPPPPYLPPVSGSLNQDRITRPASNATVACPAVKSKRTRFPAQQREKSKVNPTGLDCELKQWSKQPTDTKSTGIDNHETQQPTRTTTDVNSSSVVLADHEGEQVSMFHNPSSFSSILNAQPDAFSDSLTVNRVADDNEFSLPALQELDEFILSLSYGS